VRQTLSTLSSAASQNFTPIGSCHSLHEAVLFFAMQFLRLIGSEHVKTLPSMGVMMIGDAEVIEENAVTAATP
jgi:hypothetical protein